MNFKKFLILLVFISQAFLASAQYRKLPVIISFGNEATAIPYTTIFTSPVHPVFQFGTEFQYKTGPHFSFYQTANLGYIYHNYLYQGFYVNSQVGYDYKFNFGLNLKALFGLGYLHTFSTREEYQFSNGTYANGTDWGNARLMPMLSLGLGYRFNTENPQSTEAFLLYNSWVEYPYSPDFIPVMTHIGLEFGVKFYLAKKK